MTTRSSRVLRMVALAALLVACGGGGGGGGGGDGDGDGNLGALNFNQANMEYAAGVGARIVDMFPPVADVLDAAFIALGDVDLRSGQARALETCTEGTATLVRTDASGDGAWSVGDTARITLGNCRVHALDAQTFDGSLTLTFSSVVRGPPRTVTAGLELALAMGGDTIAGRVALTATSTDLEHYGLVFQPAPAAVLSGRGAVGFDFGCFDVRDDPNPTLGVARRVAITGVVKTLDKIMSIAPGGAVFYRADDLPGDGEFRLVSIATPECAALGVGEGVGDSDGSTMSVEATGTGGQMDLHVYRSGGQLLASGAKQWRELLHPATLAVINGTNAVDVAAAAVFALDMVESIGGFGVDLVVAKAAGHPVALCSSGSYTVSISGTGNLAAGDVASIVFNGCVATISGDTTRLDGGATFTVASVSGDVTTTSYTLAIRAQPFDVTATDDVGTTRYAGAFRLTRTAVGGDLSEHSESLPGATFTETEGAGSGAHHLTLNAFSLHGSRTSAGAYTLATAEDWAEIAATGIPGALDLAITTAFTGTSAGSSPAAGDLTVTAADASNLALHLAGDGGITLALDSDGDGAVDATIPTTWEGID